MSSGIVAASRGVGLEDSSASNVLLNSKFNNDNYPVGYTYVDNEQDLTYQQNFGVTTFLPAWASGSTTLFEGQPLIRRVGPILCILKYILYYRHKQNQGTAFASFQDI